MQVSSSVKHVWDGAMVHDGNGGNVLKRGAIIASVRDKAFYTCTSWERGDGRVEILES